MAADTWTLERVEILTTRWEAGDSGGNIARSLGLSRSAVLGKISRLGLMGTRPVQTGQINYRAAMRELAKLQRPKRQQQPPKPPRALKEHPQASGIVRRARAPTGNDYARMTPLAVDASMAKPWTERAFGQCAYPISGEGADTVSCCLKTGGKTYCAGHAAVMFWTPREDAKSLQRLAQRYAA